MLRLASVIALLSLALPSLAAAGDAAPLPPSAPPNVSLEDAPAPREASPPVRDERDPQAPRVGAPENHTARLILEGLAGLAGEAGLGYAGGYLGTALLAGSSPNVVLGTLAGVLVGATLGASLGVVLVGGLEGAPGSVLEALLGAALGGLAMGFGLLVGTVGYLGLLLPTVGAVIGIERLLFSGSAAPPRPRSAAASPGLRLFPAVTASLDGRSLFCSVVGVL